MEIKFRNRNGSIILLACIFVSSSGYANDLEEIEVNFLPSEDSEKNSADKSTIDPLKGLVISYDKIFSYQNNESIEIENKSTIQLDSLAKNKHKKHRTFMLFPRHCSSCCLPPVISLLRSSLC